MRPFTTTIPIDAARRLVLEAAVPVGHVEEVGLGSADGRVLARAVVAADDVPAFDRSAMDGYAVVAADTADATADQPTLLTCIGTVHAGEVFGRRIAPQECVAISTGAPIPDGADAVVMVEHTTAAGDRVGVAKPVAARQHVGRRGADMSAGQIVLEPGQLLTPSRLGALAATGAATATVFAQPRVAIIPTGNEVVPPGRPLRQGQVHDVNRYTLSAVVRAHGGLPVPLDIAADTIESLDTALAAAADCDLLVFSGGSSVGDRDLVIDALRSAGEVLFHGIAVKPGKPTAFGRIGHQLVLGMPGNPTSCLSNAYVLLIPLLRRLAHLPPHAPRTVRVPLTEGIASTANRHQFYSVAVRDGQAIPAFKGSGEITSMSRADGYIEVPVGVDRVEAGTMVEVTFY